MVVTATAAKQRNAIEVGQMPGALGAEILGCDVRHLDDKGFSFSTRGSACPRRRRGPLKT